MIIGWKLLVQSRKASSSSAAKIKSSGGTAASGRIMKLLVKMRCIISGLHMGLGSMGASSLIQCPCSTADHIYNNGRICWISNAFMKMKAFEKWFSWAHNHLLSTMRLSSTKGEIVLDQMKVDTTRRNYLFGSSSCGVMRPLNKTKTGSKSRCRLNKSCPTSIKSSPVHQSGDNASLVHAAVAHCKKSFRGETETDDFS